MTMLISCGANALVGKLLQHHEYIAALQQLLQAVNDTSRQTVLHAHRNAQPLLGRDAGSAGAQAWQQHMQGQPTGMQKSCSHAQGQSPGKLAKRQQPCLHTHSLAGFASRVNIISRSPTAAVRMQWPNCNLLASSTGMNRAPLAASVCMQLQRSFVRPCSDSVDEDASSSGGVAATRTVYTTSSAAAAGPPSSDEAASGLTNPNEESAASRRGSTESRAALRRTTESRAAIEDVSVMTKSQMMRRNKPWLKEQCNHKGLSYDGLKEDLVQRLLQWQGTDAGRAAAIAARDAIAAASKAVQEVQAAAAAAAAAERTAAAAAAAAEAGAASADLAPPPTLAVASAAPATAANHSAAEAAVGVQLDVPSSNNGMGSKRRRRSTSSTAAECSTSSSSSDMKTVVQPSNADQQELHCQQLQQQQQQPPRSAAAAAVDTLAALLEQLQQQPDNSALVAVARNSLEVCVQGLAYGTDSKSSSGLTASSCSTAQHQVVSALSSKIMASSSPQSIAALATACFSREVQSPVLAAAMSEAVAAVAKQLGPQEVYRVLRLLVEHLSNASADRVGSSTLGKGFRVLAEGFIGCSEALEPMHLAEAVDLLWKHKYDDSYGLWMISKEAAARSREFAPHDVVMLLDAIAGMCVADDEMCSDVAAAVAATRHAYTGQQLDSVRAALRRMGYSNEL